MSFRDWLVRALPPDSVSLEIRSGDDGEKPTLVGHFAVFDRWAEIESHVEGRFVERIAPGAFKKTFREQRGSMRVLLQHGRDPEVGDKPIASIDVLRQDDVGAYYEASLLGGLPDLVLNGIRAKQYGASFRFSVIKQEFRKSPGASEHNPTGMPERTLQELRVPEFGPCTFPAYADASAGMRSLTDDFVRDRPPGDVREPTLDRWLAGELTLEEELLLRAELVADMRRAGERPGAAAEYFSSQEFHDRALEHADQLRADRLARERRDFARDYGWVRP